MRQLQRRDQQVALADAEVHGLARKPDLVRRLLEGVLLPLGRGQQAGLLAADVDAGERAVAEGRHELGDALGADGRGEAVEVHVAGLGDRVLQVDVAVPAALAFAEQQAAAGRWNTPAQNSCWLGSTT